MVAAILSLFVFLLDFAVVLATPIPMRHGPLHQAQVGKRSYRTLRPRSGSSGDSGFGNGEELVEVVHGSTVPFNGGGRFLTMDRGSSSKGATSSSTDSFMSTTTVGPPSATDTSTLTVTSSSIGGGDGGGNGAMALETATTPIPTATATSVPPPGSSRPDNDDSQNWVDAHNTARAQYGAGKLTWSSSLASKAQANAQLCTHSHTNAGENIAWGGALTPEQSVDMWMSEAAQYNWNAPGYADTTGHFTQVVWKKSNTIGCFTATCKDGGVETTCEYDPAGNVVNSGEFAANVGKKGRG